MCYESGNIKVICLSGILVENRELAVNTGKVENHINRLPIKMKHIKYVFLYINVVCRAYTFTLYLSIEIHKLT